MSVYKSWFIKSYSERSANIGIIPGGFMFFDFEKEELPEIFIRDNKNYYLDPIRKKLILITPEETVRQKMINFIMNSLKVPQKLISVEERLSHYGVNNKMRADIIIDSNDDLGNMYPLCIIECKAPEIPITDKTLDQVFKYCEHLKAPYAIVTNGYSTFEYKYNEDIEEYIKLENIPTFEEMLNAEYVEYECEEETERLPFYALKQKVESNQYEECISYMTPKELALPAHNLLECFLDYRVPIPTGYYGVFTLIKDFGIRELSFGNHSGGMFFGPYRSFLIKFNENTEFVSFGISTYGCSSSDVVKTVINVAIDNEEISHHSLQLVLEDNLVIHDGICDFYHHGKIAIGNKGSGRISELRSAVELVAPDLIDGNKFYLGSLPVDRLWTLQDKDVIELVNNMICYALIRDSYRKYKKNKK